VKHMAIYIYEACTLRICISVSVCVCVYLFVCVCVCVCHDVSCRDCKFSVFHRYLIMTNQ